MIELLNHYFPDLPIKNTRVLDAMAGKTWLNIRALYEFFEGCEVIVGVDKRGNSTIKREIESRYDKLECRITDLLNLSEEFDMIITLRPNPYEDDLLKIYQHLHELLAPNGILFATTYTKKEFTLVSDAIRQAGFNITRQGANEHDKVHHPHYIIADIKPLL